MRCEEAREEMLTARPGELAGEETTPLSSHLTGCPACRRRATAVLDGQSELARTLERLSRGEAEGRDSQGFGGSEQIPETPSRRLPGLVAGAAGAVLAAAAALLVWTGPGFLSQTDGSGDAVVVVGDRGAPPSFGLEVPTDGRVAVFQTGDPRFVVVWQYDPTL